VDNGVGSSKIGSSKRDPLSRTSVLMGIGETVGTKVGTVEDVLVKMTGHRSGDSTASWKTKLAIKGGDSRRKGRR